jgi:hypothetical protein
VRTIFVNRRGDACDVRTVSPLLVERERKRRAALRVWAWVVIGWAVVLFVCFLVWLVRR